MKKDKLRNEHNIIHGRGSVKVAKVATKITSCEEEGKEQMLRRMSDARKEI